MRDCQKILAVVLIIWGIAGLADIAGDYRKAEKIYTGARTRRIELKSGPQDTDVVGWLRMDQAGIDYPVVQGKDNEFYLTHAYDKTENASGSIMMNCDNTSTFSDSNTILYGHNMKNGTMFGRLKNLADLQEKLVDIVIQTPQEERHYQIICIAKVDEMAPIFQIKLTGAQFAARTKELKEDALYWREVSGKQPQQFLTLVTCSGRLKLIIVAGA